METMFSASSVSVPREAASTFDELSMQQSLLFSDSLKDLRNLRSQLYSAAEYFELSYTNDDQKHMVVETLKDYAIKAFVNTVDHLGSVSYKVNGLLDEKVEEVSGTELRVSCIEQRLRTCQEHFDREGLAQQSLIITAPKYHKRYILPAGESMLGSGPGQAIANNEGLSDHNESNDSKLFQAVRSTMRDSPSSATRRAPSPSPSLKSRYRSPSRRARSPSPSRKARSPSPSPRPGKFFSEKRAVSPLPTSNPLLRSGSLASRPAISNSLSTVKRYPSAPRKSLSMRMPAEKDEKKEDEENTSRSKRFLKALLSRRKSQRDDMLYSYLDEY
ncbi:Protein ABIL3 [Acorus calamus]|uniref:Protein ABIL3 n=1 Tax=Acorus calamus TaxID=4465 RepID=A0AAV9DQP6_ACOCL|nr:Protein ABIL3 [Acorus calamus]